MRSLATGAINDFNLTVDGIKESCSDQDIRVSVVECGVGHIGSVVAKENNIDISNIKHLIQYSTTGGSTPLFDSVNTIISMLLSNARYGNYSNDAFLVMVITDGHDNSSRLSAYELSLMIKEYQNTDKWTFVFRVPVGYKQALLRLGIPSGNIMEWEQTNSSLVASTENTISATKSYFAMRSAGVTSTDKFFVDTRNISSSVVKKNLTEATWKYELLSVKNYEQDVQIRDFITARGFKFNKGCSYYQLTKTEEVQPNKIFMLRDRSTGKLYEGDTSARSILGLPASGRFKITPSNNSGQYDIFIQSTSVNRKLVKDTNVLYKW